MSARKSIHRRLSRQSIQSQMSGILNPDSYVDSDEEGDPLWFKAFQDNSVTTRPSARFSSAQNDTPVLDPDSEPDSTPLQKSWWKNLDNTRRSQGPVTRESRERSSVSEKSLDASEAALLNEGVAKPRSQTRHFKRKSSGRNVFSDILASTSRGPTSPENISGNSENRDRQESSVSYTDSSVEMRQPPVKRKKNSKMPRGSLNLGSNSDENSPDIFQDALESPQSHDDSGHDQAGTSRKNRESSVRDSINSVERIQLRRGDSRSENREVPSDTSEETTHMDRDAERSKLPLVSHSKKRTVFTKSGNRKSANFDDLLADAQSEDDPSIRGEEGANRSKTHVKSGNQPIPGLAGPESDISFQEDDSTSEEIIKKQRIIFPRKKRKRFVSELLESSYISIRSEPDKTMEFVHPRAVPSSDVKRRSSRQGNNHSHTSGPWNLEAEESQAARTSARGSSGVNESVRQSVSKVNDRAVISTPQNVDDEQNRAGGTQNRQSHAADAFESEERSISETEDSGEPSYPSDIELVYRLAKETSHRSSRANKSDQERRSRNEVVKNDGGKSSGSSHVGDEESQPATTASRRSDSANRSDRQSLNEANTRSRIYRSPDIDDTENEAGRTSRGADESDAEEEATEEEDDRVESPSPPDLEEEETRLLRKFSGRSSSTNKSSKEGRFGNETDDRRRSSRSSNVGNEENPSPIISLRRSGSANKSQNSVQDKSSLNQSRISEKRLITENKNTSRSVSRKSISQELAVSNDEEDEDPRNIFGSINRSEKDQEDSRELASSQLGGAASPRNVEAEIPSTSSPANKAGRKTKSASKTPRRSILAPELEKTAEALGRTNTDTEGERDKLQTEDRQSAGRNFSFADSIGRGSVQRPNGVGRGLDPETLSQMKIGLEKVKKQELANLEHMNKMKNTKIDAYFKSTLTTKSTSAAKGRKKSTTEPKPVNKAYMMDGKVYKRPKLQRPKKWATDRLYQYLWKKLEPKYNIRTRVRSEKFVLDLCNVATIIQRRTKYENYQAELNTLLKEMARLGIIQTRNEFHLFCQDYLPSEFCAKVIPMVLPGNVRNIPFYPDKLHTPILDSLD